MRDENINLNLVISNLNKEQTLSEEAIDRLNKKLSSVRKEASKV